MNLRAGYGIIAGLSENTRCVVVCRNKAHKDFLLKNVPLG